MTIFLCAASVTVSFSAKFSEPQYRPLRATVFFSYAFFSFIPAVHWFWVHSDDKTFYHSSFRTAIICLTAMAIFYIIGAIVYALRIPERFCPGKFDFYVSVSIESIFRFILICFVFSFIRINYSMYL